MTTSPTPINEDLYDAQPGALEAAALDREIVRLELRIVRAWQVLGVLGLAFSVPTWGYISVSWRIGSTLLVFVYLCWFTLYGALLKRSRGGLPLRMVGVVVESTLPWVLLTVQALAQGAQFALGSWLAPFAFAALMVAAAARLRPISAVVLGVASGILFALCYFLVLRPRLPPAAMHIPNFTPAMQLSKAAGLMLGGVVCGLVAYGLARR